MKRVGSSAELRLLSSEEVGTYVADREIVHITPQLVVGGEALVVMAGPCSVESEEQLFKIADFVKSAGAVMLRGGAFKPRTSPFAFQGLGSQALKFLQHAKETTGLPIVSEIIDPRQLAEMHDVVDLFQVGARNMYNYPLLKELGSISKPVLLKKSMMATVDEFLGAADYILSRGNKNVILCERGIRTFDNNRRFALDLGVIPVLRERSRLPILVDPSHGTGVARYVESMSLAAIAAGADGLLVEVHHQPEAALSDGMQSLNFKEFEKMISSLKRLSYALGRTI